MNFITKRFVALAALLEVILAGGASYTQLTSAEALAATTNIGSITFEQALVREVVMEWVFVNEPIIGVTATVILMLLPSAAIAKAILFGVDRIRSGDVTLTR